MKHFIAAFCLVLAIMLAPQEADAQGKHGLTARALWYNYENPEPDWDNWSDVFKTSGRGFEVAYNRFFDKHTSLVVPLKIGTAPVPSERNGNVGVQGANELLMNLDAHLEFSFFKRGKLFNPYVLVGAGTTWNVDDEHFDFNIPAGLGLNIRLAKNLYANAQTQYRFSIEDRPGWHHGIGIVFCFGDIDSDDDGILDKDDRCPDVKGVAALAGCPDRDGDGIGDTEDRCPDLPGSATAMGCPDRDGDSFADSDDKCPDVAGIAAFMGCPDRDGDGIQDSEDVCPELAGSPMYKGCPDTDGDGISDNNDKCPREAGTAANQGCPVRDRDGDGVPDANDACPDQYGGAATRGCPDRDGDGVLDSEDRCPDKAGPAANKGCPEIKVEDKAKLERAVKLVQFQTGKAVLLKSSYSVLDEIVTVMNTYPEYSLKISGHTDATGDDKLNMALSEKRANACHEYLISKGIAKNRMSHAGYGETQPVADNKTAAGREQNRRVVFELYVK